MPHLVVMGCTCHTQSLNKRTITLNSQTAHFKNLYLEYKAMFSVTACWREDKLKTKWLILGTKFSPLKFSLNKILILKFKTIIIIA